MVGTEILKSYNLVRSKPTMRTSKPKRDLGTSEMQAKRAAQRALQDFDYGNTVAGCLLKSGYLKLDEVESLQKIYVLRRRYLSLQKISDTLPSASIRWGQPSLPKGFFQHMEENEILENQWKNLVNLLNFHDPLILKCVLKLFAVHAYESLQGGYGRFIKEFETETLRDFAYYGWSAWKCIKDNKKHGLSTMPKRLEASTNA